MRVTLKVILAIAWFGSVSQGCYKLARDNEADDNEVAASDTFLESPDCRFEGFDEAISYTPSAEPFSITIADFSGDGRPDILPGENRDDGTTMCEMLVNTQNGSFKKSALSEAGDCRFADAAVADFNGDDLLDLAGKNRIDLFDSIDDAGEITIDFGIGDGLFATEFLVFPTPQKGGMPIAGDFDGDGLSDLAFAGNDYISTSNDGLRMFEPANFTVSVFLNEGDESFTEPVRYENLYPWQ